MSIEAKSTLTALFAALLLSGCSSNNPDSLVGMNVDENAAMMDANASSEADAAAATPQNDSNDTSAHASSDRSDHADAAAEVSAVHDDSSAIDNVMRIENSPEDESSANGLGNSEEPNPDDAPSH